MVLHSSGNGVLLKLKKMADTPLIISDRMSLYSRPSSSNGRQKSLSDVKWFCSPLPSMCPVEKPAETKDNNQLASSLIRAPNSVC
jgi:hypothetical protein